MTTEPTTGSPALDPTRWYEVAENTEALSIPGGALVRVCARAFSGTEMLSLTFVPGAAVEPNGHEYGIDARLVAAPAPTTTIVGGARPESAGAPSPEFVANLRRAIEQEAQSRRARPTADGPADSAPPVVLRTISDAEAPGALADFELHGRVAAHLAPGDYFTAGGNLLRLVPTGSACVMFDVIGRADGHRWTVSTVDPTPDDGA